jgi:hypothetical protein
MKEFVRNSFPRFFAVARRVKDQLFIEGRVIRQVGPRILLDRFVRTPANWQEQLPLQKPLRREIQGLELAIPEDLAGYLRSNHLPYSEGGHTIYLPPETIAQSPFAPLAAYYPAGAGLKVMKNPGGPADSDYVYGEGHSEIHRRLTYDHAHLTLVANTLHLHGLGPRLYDLLELRVGERVWTAYVVEHCGGRTPTMQECEVAMTRLRELDRCGLLKVCAPGGFGHMDFACPDCNGNALVDAETGAFRYFDFQNFLLSGYGDYLETLALEAATDTHFGQQSLLRGGRYLYQSVPGVGLAAKRSIEDRVALFRTLLQESGCSVEGKLVLDVGCNIGMMLGQYLKMGAAWVHGWDMEIVAQHAAKLLLALGCTRFSLTPGKILVDQTVESDLPVHTHHMLDGCVISYLAIRGHVGWLQALRRVPWSFMIYEGHEADTDEDFESHMTTLRSHCAFHVAAKRIYEDGDCIARPLAILVREVQ